MSERYVPEPYIIGHPIKEPGNFYGFHELVAQFYSIVGGRQAQSVSLLGLKRSGKTSLLYYLAHPSVLAQYVVNPDAYVTLHVDFSICNTPAKFYRQVHQGLSRLLSNASAQEHEHLRDLPGAENITWLLRQYPGRRVVLLLDEFNRVIHGTFDQDFLSELRAIVSAPDNELAIVTASYNSLEHVGGRLGLASTSPFYNIFYPKHLYLNGLDEIAARDLIRKPAEQEGVFFTDDEVENIQSMAGTFPFLLQMTAGKWFLAKREGQPVNREELQRELINEARPYCESWLRDLGEENLLLLCEIAKKQYIPSTTFQEPNRQEHLQFLRNYGLVIEEQGTLCVNGLVLATWIRREIAKQHGEPIRNLKITAEVTAQPNSKKKMLVFLSHTSEDKVKVRKLAKRLREDGFDPWLDEEQLLPGQDWNLEIEKALRASDAILLCFSALSVGKEGYIQREYKRAMKYREEKPEGTIFVIPVRLDNCDLPYFVREVHWVDYPADYNRLVKSLRARAQSSAIAKKIAKSKPKKAPK